MDAPENAPPPSKFFHIIYRLAAWAGVLLMICIVTWLFWTLFVHTASGTTRGLSVDVSKATQTAIAQVLPTPTVGAGVVELPAACRGCHTIAGTSAAGTVCPDLTHIATLAAGIIKSPDYTGKATTVADYVKESILTPSVYIVPDKPSYATTNAAGEKQSIMPAAIGAALSANDLDKLVTYLASLQ